ncbi:MAG: hypothetical protein CVV41_00035 [Candidatus Riflebacteria bacterium HGW-Riflebacteria-1]|jgi:23S rRNA pseudouridine1911/1915/1917 synthase|nr:MAG: hypothetical protein CVV41_00035 [Candidatus Riflebacteria bacterium HGW-Riflebacteria-1]
MKYRLELNSDVLEKFAGESLIDSLARRFTYQSREFWLEKVAAGQVRVNGLISQPGHVLAVGEVVQFAIDDFTEPDLDLDYQKIWENENLIIVSKPADLPVHSNRRFYFQTMTAILRRDEKIPDLNPMHRLDRETSGLMLYLKKPFAGRRLRRDPGQIISAKFYLALVSGVFEHESLVVDAPLREAACPPVYYLMVVAPDGRPSCTVFERIAIGEDCSLVLARLESGRKHQIRAHLAHVGHPVVGDKLYSHDGRYFMKRCNDELAPEDLVEIGSPHQLLHAWALCLQLPEEGRRMFFSDHFSDSWQSRLKQFTTWREQACQVVNRYIESL